MKVSRTSRIIILIWNAWEAYYKNSKAILVDITGLARKKKDKHKRGLGIVHKARELKRKMFPWVVEGKLPSIGDWNLKFKWVNLNFTLKAFFKN